MTQHSTDNVPVLVLSRIQGGYMLLSGLLLAGCTFCAAGMLRMDPDALGDLGIVSIMGWRSWLGLALLVIGFSTSLTGRLHQTVLPWLFLFALVAALHLVPAYAYGTLRYSWAWKHIGIIDYIMRHGGLERDIAYLSAYHNWPGFFVAWAWLAQQFSLKPLEIAAVAAYAPPVFAMAYQIVLHALFLRFTQDRRLIFLAQFVFLGGNWIGQDYFAPQAVTYLLYLVAMLLCAGPLAQNNARFPLEPHPPLAWPPKFLSRVAPNPEFPSRRGSAVAAASLLLAMIVLLAVSHQLTPIVLAATLTGLALLRRIDFGFAAFAAVVIVLWDLYFAAPFVSQSLAGELESFGAAFVNATDKMADLRELSRDQVIVSIVARALTVGVMLLGIVGIIRRWRAGHIDLLLLVMLAAPLPIFVMTSYGGEAVFRVYLFMLPTLAFLGAASVFPAELHGRRAWTPLVITLIGSSLIIGFVISNNGKDMQYRFRQNEIDAAAWLYDHAPAGTLLIEGARNYPSQFANYENFVYVPIANESPQAREEIARDPASVLYRWLSDARWRAGFVILTRSQEAYAETQGVVPEGTFDHIKDVLSASPNFKTVYRNADAVIFSLNEWAPGGALDPSR
nr:hypothetical protein RKHAN_02759 [Rhizobium sp. Khangiran2]